jgi:DNA (cytosine-5)-methyltransferase 1
MKSDIEFVRSSKGISFELRLKSAIGRLNVESLLRTERSSCIRAIDEWDRLVLLGRKPISETETFDKSLKIVDLFCGAGGFTEGVIQGCQSIGVSTEVIAACDIDSKALQIYKLNHNPKLIMPRDLNTYLDYSLRRRRGDDVELGEVRYSGHDLQAIEILMDGCDILVAGPPCQGHSNLNNHSRRNDPRNNLYLSVAAYAALLRPKWIAIENVQAVIHDKTSIVDRTKNVLANLGYTTEEITVNGVDVGLPQTRKRHFLIAKKQSTVSLGQLVDAYKHYFETPRPLSWCLEIAPRIYDYENDFYLPSTLSPDNQLRVNWLIENDTYDLPNELRPLCHQKEHNYKSIYGRLHWDKPSGTITTGFHSPGRGRYVHPKEPRVITACEASLIQGFPLSYKFFSNDFNPGRNILSKVIGDAVSPQMSKVIGLNFALESLLSKECLPVLTGPDYQDFAVAS